MKKTHLAVGIVLVVTIGSTLGVAGVSGPDQQQSIGDEQPAFGVTAESGDSADVRSVPTPIDGTVTSPPTHLADRLVVGTERGLYVFADGSFERFVQTGPVRTVGQVDGDVAIVLVADRQFPNVKAVDLSSGEVVWSTARERSVYSQDMGYLDRQVPAFDTEPIGDVDGDGTGDVAVSLGARVVALSGASGEQLWEYEHQRNVWQLTTVDGNLMAGTQSGHLLSLDPSSGDRDFAERLTEPFEGSGASVETVPQSVWSLEPVTIDGAEKVAVTTEDGAVSVVDPSDGTVDWRTEIKEFDDDLLERYYRSGDRDGTPTAPGDSLYFNLELTVVEAAGSDKLAVDATVEERPSERRYETASSTLHLLDARSGEQEWSTDRYDLERVGTIDSNGEIEDGNLLLSMPPEGGSQEINVVSLDDGTDAGTITVDVVPPAQQHQPQSGTGYLATTGNEIAVTASNGDLVVVDGTGSVEWSYPSITDVRLRAVADFTGDGTEDYLLAEPGTFQRAAQHRSLQVRSGVDGTVVWSAVLDADLIGESGGYTMVRPVERDGNVDVLAVRQHPDRERSDGTIVLRSGADGSVLETYEIARNDEPIRLSSVEPIGDVTGNGNQNALVSDQRGVVVLDLEAGTVVWERFYDERFDRQSSDRECDRIEEQLEDDLSDDRRDELEARWEELDCENRDDQGSTVWNPFDEAGEIQYRAVGGDTEDTRVVAIHPRAGEVAVLAPVSSGEQLSFEVDETVSIDGTIQEDTIRTLGDVTGDGYEELRFDIRNEDASETAVFSPGDGAIGARMDSSSQLSLVSTDADFTGDGTPGMVAFERGEQSRLIAYSGTDRVWSQQMERPPVPSVGTPAAPAGDVDGDGSEELAVVESSERDGSGARVKLYDVGTGDLVDTIVLESWEAGVGEPFPGVHAERLPDQTGNGEPEIGVVAATGADFETDLEYFVVDPSDGEVLISGDGARSRFLALEDGVGLLDDGSVTTVDVTEGVTLHEPEEGSSVSLEWTFDVDGEYVTTVLVNDRPVTMTTERKITVDLPPGTHEITLQAMDSNGIVYHDTAEVTVEDGSSMDLVLYGMTALAILLLFALGGTFGLVRRVRR